jgi:DNA invertase Pin-like site-specific DNA recombinase
LSRYKPPSDAVYRAPAPGARVLVYCRFSGQDQDGASQESALRQWITEKGWTVYPGGWFLDEAKSGSSTEGRDGFRAMIKLAERLAKEADRPAGVVCWKLDRFGRSFLDNLRYKAVLRSLGYSITSMADAVPEGSLAPLVEALLDTQAEAYLKEISANTKRGHALLRGLGYATGGFPPFGLMEAREPMGQRASGEIRQGTPPRPPAC